MSTETEKARSSPRALLLALLLTAGCAAQQHIKRGQSLLGEGKYSEAVAAFEEALRIAPSNKQAEAGIRQARREAVAAELGKSDKAFAAADFAKALSLAMRARRMPMDLEDVALVRRLDEAIANSASGAEARVKELSEDGRFVPAVELADAVVLASPGDKERKAWADELRAKAIGHYSKLGGDLEAQGLRGSAAVQLAMARKVGAAIAADRVIALWNQFVEPICFAAPSVAVSDASGRAGKLVQTIEAAARAELESLRAACGEGTRPLGVTIQLITVSVTDESSSERHAKALPGSKIQTEESYVEETPYTETEEVTEYETRTEKQEKRDCAPRPGQERGCRTWVEDVTVKVPVKRTREVQKLRRVEKSRPAKGPFPADEVVTYDVTSVRRQVRYEGSIQIGGAAGEPRRFVVVQSSNDSGHPEVSHPRMKLPADPMEAKSLEALAAEASAAVSEELKAAVAKAVGEWSVAYAEQARQRALEGHLPQAEELFLRRLALGVQEDQQLAKFFSDRYGKGVAEVMGALVVAMGREVESGAASDAGAAATRFPTRVTPAKSTIIDAPETVPEAAVKTVADEPAPPPKNEGKPDVSAMADDELTALEAASLDDKKSREGEVSPTTDGAAPPAPIPPPDEAAKDPSRRPIVPK